MPDSHDTLNLPSNQEEANFEVDSALLRELGERLVSAPHIALGELIKNSYDADATICQVHVSDDQIIVTDNGHGMTKPQFLRYWMRIGTTHKQEQTHSPKFNRPVTGSKGVGRLAAQFLAHKLEITTVGTERTSEQLVASVDWDEAVDSGELTNAKAIYSIVERTESFPEGGQTGTKVVLSGLKHDWGAKEMRQLARQLWRLQPPMAKVFGNTRTGLADPSAFQIALTGKGSEETKAFESQMTSALSNWMAQIEGSIRHERGKAFITVTVHFDGGQTYREEFETGGKIQEATWLIRIFNLSGKQPGGIPVAEAREYFERFGGVMVYDSGFRLPYYGVEQDWLGIEYDHSHRRSVSKLLPERLRFERALNDLPTQGRIFGLVKINTGGEAAQASQAQKEQGDFLKIQVTRDRLVANQAFEELRDAVRISLDYYATRKRIKDSQSVAKQRPSEPSHEKIHRALDTLTAAKSTIPEDVWESVTREISDFEVARTAESKARESEQSLLAPIASAGMAALAIEHETGKDLAKGDGLVRDLRLAAGDRDAVLRVADRLAEWLSAIRKTRAIFAPLLDESDREDVEPLQAYPILQDVVSNLRPILGNVKISIASEKEERFLYFPSATYSEWHALFQNVIINASNAMLDADEPKLLISLGSSGKTHFVRVSDNGVGLDLASADDVFEPFSRHSSISDERRKLGLGGMGLGLTIVRMIAENRRCRVEFVEPEDGFATTFELSWRS